MNYKIIDGEKVYGYRWIILALMGLACIVVNGSTLVFAGMAGVLFAMNYSAIEAKKFNFNTSISVLVMVVLGGMGSFTGSVLAAVVLTLLPELLRDLADYRMLIYSVVLIVVMVLNNNARFQQFKLSFRKKLSNFFRRIFRKKEAKA